MIIPVLYNFFIINIKKLCIIINLYNNYFLKKKLIHIIIFMKKFKVKIIYLLFYYFSLTMGMILIYYTLLL